MRSYMSLFAQTRRSMIDPFAPDPVICGLMASGSFSVAAIYGNRVTGRCRLHRVTFMRRAGGIIPTVVMFGQGEAGGLAMVIAAVVIIIITGTGVVTSTTIIMVAGDGQEGSSLLMPLNGAP